MINTMKLLKRYHVTEIPEDEEVIPLTDCSYYFHVMPYRTKYEGKSREFIEMLKEEFSSGVVYDSLGSGRYFFKTGTSVVELCVTIDNSEIYIESYLCYRKENINKELYRIIKLDYLIYCLLRRYELQSK